jgi:hypothetical protein
MEQKVDATAQIVRVVEECGNRINKLTFDKPMLNKRGEPAKAGMILLDLANNPDQKALFYDVHEDIVAVNIHKCPDLPEADMYYVWQRRLPGRSPACPRCKRRIDFMQFPAST